MTSAVTVTHADLFAEPQYRPLADRMRPQQLSEYCGQQHLLGAGRPLYQAVTQQQLHSMILWGPPGTGKTTLARLLCAGVNAQFVTLSAVTSGVKEIRQAIQEAQQLREKGRQTVLFIDEVHRFNKSQQDAFLPHIEDGTIIFIGATTENPAFEVNRALLSRARAYRLESLADADILRLLERALTDSENGLGRLNLDFSVEAKELLVKYAGGDARRALSLLEIVSEGRNDTQVSAADLQAVVSERQLAFDKGGDVFYDILSAFHKSIRGSSVDGGLYWYARVLQAGGDPLVIARRLLAIASEDIGLADPQALQVCLNAWDYFHRLGPAEGERAIAEAVVYCALAPKSNALYQAFKSAKKLAADYPDAEVPHHLRNAPTAVHKEQGYGADYRYAHDYPNHYVAGERYLPSQIKPAETGLYQPSERGYEKRYQEKLSWLAELDRSSDWQRGDDE